MFIYGRTAAPTARLIENKTLFIENGNRRVNCASKYVIHFIALFTHAYLIFYLKYQYLEPTLRTRSCCLGGASKVLNFIYEMNK